MDQSKLTYVKLSVVAIAVAGVFVVAAIGKIAPAEAMTGVVTLVTGLVVALGISASGSAITNASKLAIDAQKTLMARFDHAEPLPPPPAPNAAASAVKTAILLLAFGALIRGTTACHAPPAQVANDVVIGLDATACVLDVYAVDSAENRQWDTIVADALAQCSKYGVTSAQVNGVLAAHRHAEIREGFVPRVAPPAAK